MKYKLKPGVESFDVVDGEFAGKKYRKGKVYDKIPPIEKNKFEEVRDQKSEAGGKKKSEKQPQTSNLKPNATDGEAGGAT